MNDTNVSQPERLRTINEFDQRVLASRDDYSRYREVIGSIDGLVDAALVDVLSIGQAAQLGHNLLDMVEAAYKR